MVDTATHQELVGHLSAVISERSDCWRHLEAICFRCHRRRRDNNDDVDDDDGEKRFRRDSVVDSVVEIVRVVLVTFAFARPHVRPARVGRNRRTTPSVRHSSRGKRLRNILENRSSHRNATTNESPLAFTTRRGFIGGIGPPQKHHRQCLISENRTAIYIPLVYLDVTVPAVAVAGRCVCATAEPSTRVVSRSARWPATVDLPTGRMTTESKLFGGRQINKYIMQLNCSFVEACTLRRERSLPLRPSFQQPIDQSLNVNEPIGLMQCGPQTVLLLPVASEAGIVNSADLDCHGVGDRCERTKEAFEDGPQRQAAEECVQTTAFGSIARGLVTGMREMAATRPCRTAAR